jgi:hypothetical protein
MNSRIVNGNPVLNGDFPFYALILVSTGPAENLRCAGALIEDMSGYGGF